MNMWNGFRANMFNNLFCNKVPVCRQSFREGHHYLCEQKHHTLLSVLLTRRAL